ncbi:NACHT domain-containing protein [Diaporthe sp. PMI_573]|nr:NACHT domain-containing protein [Diaporthaceae sp. PMI_573]
MKVNQGGSWILGNDDFQRWRNGQNQLLWVRGDPGKGKTMLLCGVINHLEELPATNISYFFCQATDKRINSATAVLRGLIFLLINQQPLLIRHIRDKYDQAGRQLFEDINAWVALSAILKDSLQDPGLRITYLVVDALNECITGLDDLVRLIIQTSTANSRVKWVVSSRNWPSIENAFISKLKKFGLSLELNEKSVSAAVATYIEFKTETLAKDDNYDLDTQDFVKSYLIQYAGGTFSLITL